ncbi:hypothetical protein [Endozoicomonas sp. GU-1]|uniref:hypothetical protein n=1 Tax=Endozoicomonas sp. GU-1 TaxID=3009078 RepID=UPI0022B44890|nr:hypothetical protein [Endozoicomonas sp. GU-1]WBA86501.1 hypothetical protein O3276_00120 [Endozoicomonas sp. GU-1]
MKLSELSFEGVALLATGAVLALVSTGALVKLLTSLPLNGLETALSVLAGIGLQSGLYLLARQGDLFSRLITTILLLVSVLASTAFVEMAWQRHQHQISLNHQQQQAGSEQAQLLRQQLTTVQQEIDLRMSVAGRDTAGNFTTRGLQQLDNLAPLRNQASELAAQLQALNHHDATTGADSGSVQALLSGSHRFARLGLFAVIALLIDVVALCCFSRLGQLHRLVNQGGSLPVPTAPNEQTTPVERIKHRVLRGDLGAQPSQRQLIDEVKTAFRELSDDGQLIKNGQYFELRIDARGMG